MIELPPAKHYRPVQCSDSTLLALLLPRILPISKCVHIVGFTGPDPEHSNTGGHICGRHDVSSIRCKGGEYERGVPPLIWGSGKKLGNCGAGEAFLSLF